MSLAAKSDPVLSPPPAFDWADIVIGDDLKALEKRFDQYEAETLRWRSTIAAQMQAGLKKVEASIPDVPKEQAAQLIDEGVRSILEVLEKNIESFSVPMHDNPEIVSRLDLIAKLSTKAGRFIRKLLRRAEKIRVAQHATCVDMYYGLLAFRSEHEARAGGETFSDPSELASFLRRQIA